MGKKKKLAVEELNPTQAPEIRIGQNLFSANFNWKRHKSLQFSIIIFQMYQSKTQQLISCICK